MNEFLYSQNNYYLESNEENHFLYWVNNLNKKVKSKTDLLLQNDITKKNFDRKKLRQILQKYNSNYVYLRKTSEILMKNDFQEIKNNLDYLKSTYQNSVQKIYNYLFFYYFKKILNYHLNVNSLSEEDNILINNTISEVDFFICRFEDRYEKSELNELIDITNEFFCWYFNFLEKPEINISWKSKEKEKTENFYSYTEYIDESKIKIVFRKIWIILKNSWWLVRNSLNILLNSKDIWDIKDCYSEWRIVYFAWSEIIYNYIHFYYLEKYLLFHLKNTNLKKEDKIFLINTLKDLLVFKKKMEKNFSPNDLDKIIKDTRELVLWNNILDWNHDFSWVNIINDFDENDIKLFLCEIDNGFQLRNNDLEFLSEWIKLIYNNSIDWLKQNFLIFKKRYNTHKKKIYNYIYLYYAEIYINKTILEWKNDNELSKILIFIDGFKKDMENIYWKEKLENLIKNSKIFFGKLI